MIDEKELMFQVKAGHVEQLAQLYESNKLALFNFFIRSGNSKALSEDLVQETFMKVLAYRSSFQGTSTFKSWLYGIARNTAADHYRKSANQQQLSDIDEHEISDDVTVVDELLSQQQHSLFQQSMNALAPEHRELILLSRFQQLNYQEIANMMDCNLNTLKARMRNAIDKLHICYKRVSKEVTQ